MIDIFLVKKNVTTIILTNCSCEQRLVAIMNFNSFTYQQENNESPDDVPFVKLLAYSIYTKDVKCDTIDSPVIEMIDFRITNNSNEIDLLRGRVSTLESENIELKTRMIELEISTANFLMRFNNLVGASLILSDVYGRTI